MPFLNQRKSGWWEWPQQWFHDPSPRKQNWPKWVRIGQMRTNWPRKNSMSTNWPKNRYELTKVRANWLKYELTWERIDFVPNKIPFMLGLSGLDTLGIFSALLKTTFMTYLLSCTPSLFWPFDIPRKDVFCLEFYFRWKYFALIDHILSENICLFCFCILVSNIYHKN